MKILSKSKLAIALSKLKVFDKPKVTLEQYPTDSEIAAEIIWNALMLSDIVDKRIADLGCGTGILGIGALIMGAREVIFVDIDEDALNICKENIKEAKELYDFEGEYIVKNSKVSLFDESVQVVLQNPPFGVKVKNADREFLEQAIKNGKVIYTMHSAATKKFIEKFSVEKNCKITNYYEFMFPLKQTMKFHKKRIERVPVGCFRIVKSV